MRWLVVLFLVAVTDLGFNASAASAGANSTYLGFDRNEYPGDDSLKVLHRTFAFSGYWLNNPPGAKTNTWIGKRSQLESAGFGFLVLFNGRLYRELKQDAVKWVRRMRW